MAKRKKAPPAASDDRPEPSPEPPEARELTPQERASQEKFYPSWETERRLMSVYNPEEGFVHPKPPAEEGTPDQPHPPSE